MIQINKHAVHVPSCPPCSPQMTSMQMHLRVRVSMLAPEWVGEAVRVGVGVQVGGVAVQGAGLAATVVVPETQHCELA